jgi:hypothetical protein
MAGSILAIVNSRRDVRCVPDSLSRYGIGVFALLQITSSRDRVQWDRLFEVPEFNDQRMSHRQAA